MKITLLKAFPDDYRQSMRIYEQNLLNSLKAILKPGDSVESFLPAGIMTSPKPARYFSQYFWYPVANAFKQSDIFHITDHSYAHLINSLSGQKAVVTFHDAIWLKTNRGQFSEKIQNIPWVKRQNLNGLRKAAAIICDSQASRRELLKTGDCDQQKIHVIYPGCEPLSLAKTKFEARAILKIGNEPCVLHVGHNRAYKNISGLLRILGALKKNIPDIRLLKVGESFDADQVRLMNELGISDNVLHLKALDREELKLAYRAADALIMPSLDEGFGFPALEAMSLDLPVVVSGNGSLPEVVGDAGIVASLESIDAFAQKVQEVLNDSVLRKKLIHKGQERVKAFSWQKTACEVLKIYQLIYSGRN